MLYCPQLDGSGSWHDARTVVRSLGLTKEEIIAAYQKINEEPESIRSLLSCLSDSEFEKLMSLIHSDRSLCEVSQNFMLEAMLMENEAQAKSLLANNGAVYLPEYDDIYSTFELFGDASDTFAADFDGFFDGVDLTTREFQYYFKNLQYLVYVQSPGYDEYMFGTVLPKMEFLETELARQLAAAKTGDSATSALWVIAVAIPSLATVVWAKRRRRT